MTIRHDAAALHTGVQMRRSRKVNPGVEVGSSDPVMDALRMVKDEGAMMRAEAERTSTPIYVTFGIETCSTDA